MMKNACLPIVLCRIVLVFLLFEGTLNAQQCNPISTPYFENFDNPNWGVGEYVYYPINLGFIDACWNRDTSSNSSFIVGPFTNNSLYYQGWSRHLDHTTGNGKFLSATIKNFGWYSSYYHLDTVEIYSPLIDLGNLTTPELSFYYFTQKTNNYWHYQRELSAFVLDSLGREYKVFSEIGNTLGWEEAIVDLSSFKNQLITIKFQWEITHNMFWNTLGIDDLSIYEKPACAKPLNLEAIYTSNTSAVINWKGGGATHWQVDFGVPGYTPGSGSGQFSTAVETFTLNGLSPSTTYDVYVRDSCGPGNVSEWKGPLQINTVCNPVIAPFTENFDNSNSWSTDTAPALNCWPRDFDYGYVWGKGSSTSSRNDGPAAGHTSGSSLDFWYETAFHNNSTYFNFNDTISTESPLIDISNLNHPFLEFWYHQYNWAPSDLEVQGFNGSSWITLLNLKSEDIRNTTLAPWKKASVDLSSLGQSIVKLKFKVNRRNTTNVVAIDDFSIAEAPACPPTATESLNVLERGINFVELDWAAAGATSWNIEYGSMGFTPGTGSVITANSTPFRITGLIDHTAYQFYVQNNCDTSGLSVWEGPAYTKTLCDVQSTPFFENFDDTVYFKESEGGRVFTNKENLSSSCFATSNKVDQSWDVITPYLAISSSRASTPDKDHTSGSGQYLMPYYWYNYYTSLSNVLYTPYIDLSNLNTPELSFWLFAMVPYADSLQININKGAGFEYLFSFKGGLQHTQLEDWKEIIVPLDSFKDDTIRLEFIAFSGKVEKGFALDDLSIHEKPLCDKPILFKATDIDSTNITFEWQSINSNTAWQIEYGPTGFVLGSGTQVALNSNPFTLSGLSEGTAYDFYLRSDCGAGVYSNWTDSLSLVTTCGYYFTPFFESFDAPVYVPSDSLTSFGQIDLCWQRSVGYYAFTPGNTGTPYSASGPANDHTTGSGNFMYVNRNTIADSTSVYEKAEIITPNIVLSDTGTPELRFWYHLFFYVNQGVEINVDVLTNSKVTHVKSIKGKKQNSSIEPWKELIVPLDTFKGDTIRVKFSSPNRSVLTQNNAAIDDVEIFSNSPCIKPDSLTLTNTGGNIVVSWRNNSASQWQVGVRVRGEQKMESIFNVMGTPSTVLSNLINDSTYEIYVRNVCSNGYTSQWAGPVYTGRICSEFVAPYTENFNSTKWVAGYGTLNQGNYIHDCWFRAQSTPIWEPRFLHSVSPLTGPDSADANYLSLNTTAGVGVGEILSPRIKIPDSIKNPHLYFEYYMYGADIDEFEIDINSGSGFSNIYSVQGQQQTSSTGHWILDSVDLNMYLDSTITLKFKGSNTGPSGEIALENIKLGHGYVPCGDLDSLSMAYNGNHSVNVFYTSIYDVEYEVVPIDSAQGTGTIYTTSSSPILVSNLGVGNQFKIFIRELCPGGVWLSDTISMPCEDPTNIIFTNEKETSIDVWVGGAYYPVQLLYYPVGQPNLSDSVSFSTSTYTITGLRPGTMYEVFAKADCYHNRQGIGILDTFETAACDTNHNFSFTLSYFSTDSARFTASPITTSSGVTYNWNFGDGTTVTGNPVNYKYQAEGRYLVTLTATDLCGNIFTISDSTDYCYKPQAKADYTVVSTSGTGMDVQFDASQSVGNIRGYWWDFGDGTQGTGMKPLHTYSTQNLNYNIILVVDDGCRKDTLESPLGSIGIEELNLLKEVKIFPNPFNDKIMVSWTATDLELSSIKVFDMSGRELLDKKLSSNQKQLGQVELSTNRLTKGVYVIKINGETESLRKVMVKD